MSTVHATPADWATYIGTPVPSSLPALLRRASLDVDMALIGAVYDDTNSGTLAALAEATCEQADALRAAGAADGNASPYTSVSAGSISLTRASKAGGKASDGTEISSRAFMVLQNAGITGMGPSIGTE